MRTTALALLAVSVIALAGCSGTCGGPCGPGVERALTADLPPNPQPDMKYCKVWVPPTYRKVPVLRQATSDGVLCENITVMQTTAEEVMVKPPLRRTVIGCDKGSDQVAVMVKPGGYRWEKDGECCWQYKYRSPEYKYCEKTLQEEGIQFCYEHPAEYKTVVTTKPVQRARRKYIPPQYKVEWIEQEFVPGRWEWRAQKACGSPPDTRKAKTIQLKSERVVICPPPKALDCGCPRTN